MALRFSGRTLRAAYVLALCLPAGALAQPQSVGRVPVTITQCDFQYTRPRMVDYIRALNLGFVNDSTKPAQMVRVKWSYTLKSGKTVTGFVTDNGTFAPGAEVHHAFQLEIDPNNQAGRQNAACTVTQVQYADATLWRPGMRGIVTPPPPTPTPTPTPEPPTP